MSDHIYPNNSPTLILDCKDAFYSLSEKEKLYAYYLSRASSIGGLIVTLQTSLESPLIFSFLYRFFSVQSIEELKEIALNKCNFTADDFDAFIIYACAVFFNYGNYKTFGDVKFIPNVQKEKFEKLISSSKFAASFQDSTTNFLSECLDKIYSLEDGECQLGFPHVGKTTYLSKNVTEEDNEFVTKFFKEKGLELVNSRLFKTNQDDTISYECRLASVLRTGDETAKDVLFSETLDSHKVTVTRGDYSGILKLVNDNLLCAAEYAANQNQVGMIRKYIESFQTGSLDAHKDGSRLWVQDINPAVESYIGFIETYRDPAGVRAEFEGFVAVVNKECSAKYSKLVENAEEFISLLPWPATYEKDKFLKPDFTSLDILTFAPYDVPIGINIPNYDDIRQSEGFKNVTLGNAINVRDPLPPNHLDAEDREIFQKYINISLELLTALHELLGHGSGKLFHKNKDGSFDFNIEVRNLETNEKISTWYEAGDTFNSVFGALSSPYEECRAESVALYLCTVNNILRIFGHEDESEQQDVIYIAWLETVLSGLSALRMYEPKTKSWLQAHSQAAFTILQVCLECGDDFVTIQKITGADGEPDLLFKMDRNKILSHGKPSLGEFLKKQQLYKSTADVSSAKTFFNKYSDVNSEGRFPFLEFRDIVLARKKPRKLLIQSNTILEGKKVVLKNYEPSPAGLIASVVDRYRDFDVAGLLEELYEKDKQHFR